MIIEYTKVIEKVVQVEISEKDYKEKFGEDYVEVILAANNGEIEIKDSWQVNEYTPEDDENLLVRQRIKNE